MIESWAYEDEARAAGFRAVCGVDEAGRGPLAGPVVAAAVILPYTVTLEGLDDSKKLSEKRREALYEEITGAALAWCAASVDAATIDEINILQATFLAMRRAVEGLSLPADFALIDGNRAPLIEIPCRTIVGGDGRSPSIAAASVIAKVTRDRYMREMAREYPEYGFEQHKAYGTRAHYAALDAHGPCPLHRKSFLKKYFAAKGGEP